MKTVRKRLKNGQFLQDLNIKLTNGITLINSGTGSGKTHYVLNDLVTNGKVIMTVPLRSQIEQLRHMYKGRNDIAFLRGSEGFDPDIDYFSNNIVCTYDMLPAILAKIHDLKKYTLVVDEVHKLYQAGSYRADALNPLLSLLSTPKKFKRVLLLTATFTPVLGNIARIMPDITYKVTMAGALKRHISVCVYDEKDDVSWADQILDRLNNMNRNGFALIRLNDMDRIDKYQEYFSRKGMKCLVVSSATQSTDAVRAAIAKQELPSDVDVVFTTAIWDEAINLNNDDSQVDSVHIIGCRTHPEEIAQFLGRFRKSAPPVFIHLSASARFMDESASQVIAGRDMKLAEKYDAYIAHAQSAMGLIRVATKENPKFDKVKMIEEVNVTAYRAVNCDLIFLTKERPGTYSVNRAGILAALYREDARQAYVSFAVLKDQLLTLLPNASVQLLPMSKADTEALESELQAVDEGLEDRREQEIKEVVERLQADYAQDTECRSLLEFCQKTPYDPPPFSWSKQRTKARLFREALELAEVVVGFDDIQAVLLNRHHSDVMSHHRSKHDYLMRALRALLAEAMEGSGAPLVLDGDASCSYVRRAFKMACEKFPELKEMVKSGKGGSYFGIWVKENNHTVVSDVRAARRLIREALHTEDGPKRNGHTNLHVLGPNWGGHRYHALDPLRPEELRARPTLESALED
jgi:hypothetical protein